MAVPYDSRMVLVEMKWKENIQQESSLTSVELWIIDPLSRFEEFDLLEVGAVAIGMMRTR